MSFELVVMCIMLCGITEAQESNETSIEYVDISASLAHVRKLQKDVKSAFHDVFKVGHSLTEYPVLYRGVSFNALINQSEEIYRTGMTIVFPNVLLNEDNNYNATSGIFTASSTDSYLFRAHACNNTTKTSFAIIRNGEKVAQSMVVVYNQHMCASAGVWVGLEEGDMVWVNSQIDDCFIYSSEHSLPSFNGTLLNLGYVGPG